MNKLNKTKKVTMLLLSGALATTSLTLFAGPTAKTNIFINGEHRATGFIEDDKTFIPLRDVSEALGVVVDWDAKVKTATLTKGDTTIVQKIGETSAKVNGNTIDAGTPAQVKAGKTYVPLRFVSETLGTEVKWDAPSRSVKITAEGVASKDEALKEKYKAMVAKSKYIRDFEMKPVTDYTTMDKVPGTSKTGKFYHQMGYATTNELPIQLHKMTHVLGIETVKLKDGTEVLELTLSVRNRDVSTPIIYASKKTGLMLEANHIEGLTETIVDMGDKTYIVKQRYHLPEEKYSGISKKNVDGVVFQNSIDEDPKNDNTLMVKTKL